MKDNEKLLFKLNVKVDTVFCETDFIRQSTVLKLSDISSDDEIKILQILKLFDIDPKIANDCIFLRVDHISSYDCGTCYLNCHVQVYQLLEVSR